MCDDIIVALKRLTISENSALRFLVNERIKAMEAYPQLQAYPKNVTIDDFRALFDKLNSSHLWLEEWDSGE